MLKQAAAIKRATQQARNAMRELDAGKLRELEQIYDTAADEVRGQIRAAADAGDQVQPQQLRPLLLQIEQILERLAQARDDSLLQGIDDAAALGVRPFTAQGIGAAGGTDAVLDATAAQRIHQAAVSFVVDFDQADGLNLSDRVWRLTQGTKETLQRAIGSAVVRGSSAAREAARLAYEGRAVPSELLQAVNGGKANQLVDLAKLLTSGDGSELWKAERVFRTEINRAHGEAFMAGAIDTPGFAGFRFLLSPAHPRADICDLLAAQNIHGLGPGVYPTRELTPWPAHPNTISFLNIVFESEISEQDRAGKETELQAIQRMAPEIREGVLGKTKAQYFDRGLLTRGMIRAPLRAVEARIEREALRGARAHPLALENWSLAEMPRSKTVGYALNANHGKGKHKARVFARLGFTPANVDELERQIREQLPRASAVAGLVDGFGRRFNVDVPVQGTSAGGTVRTSWILRPGVAAPQLTSLRPLKR